MLTHIFEFYNLCHLLSLGNPYTHGDISKRIFSSKYLYSSAVTSKLIFLTTALTSSVRSLHYDCPN
jgi:hypothetical protein